MTNPAIRAGLDSDADGIIRLISTCWSAYSGIIVDVDGEMPELRALATYYASQGGALWIAEIESGIVGMIATRPLTAGAWEICRVYVLPSLHGDGLGHRLLDLAEAHALASDATRFVLWSDTRFERAHRFYAKRSYVRDGPIRVLNDRSNSLEYGYAKPVDGMMVLDAAAAASAELRMAEILVICVAEGAALSFLKPLSMEKARGFWRRMTRGVANGNKVILAGWHGGLLVATGMLDLDLPENQPHRADVQKVMVDPSARRRGLARRMLCALEEEALAAGRTLLTLDTRAGQPAVEALYRTEGWREYGRLAGHAVDNDGHLAETVFFAREIGEPP